MPETSMGWPEAFAVAVSCVSMAAMVWAPKATLQVGKVQTIVSGLEGALVRYVHPYELCYFIRDFDKGLFVEPGVFTLTKVPE